MSFNIKQKGKGEGGKDATERSRPDKKKVRKDRRLIPAVRKKEGGQGALDGVKDSHL